MTTGIELLKSLPETPEHTQQALTLYTALGAALVMAKGQGAPEVEHAYIQAHALCQQVGETPELVPVLYGLYRFYAGRLQLHTARELGDTLLRLAQRAQDPALAVIAHSALGATWLLPWRIAGCPDLHLEESHRPLTHQTSVRALVVPLHGGPNPGSDLPSLCRADPAGCWGIQSKPWRASTRPWRLAHELPHPYSLAHGRSCGRPGSISVRWDVPGRARRRQRPRVRRSRLRARA